MHASISHALRRIWRVNVWNDFRDGIIASERELQACVYYHLREELSATAAGYARIFVEPSIKNLPENSKLSRRPDLIVAAPQEDEPNSMHVIAILELKLDRGKHIIYRCELDRVEELGAHSCITIDNQRPDSKTPTIPLHIDERTRFFLGFVGGSEAAAVYPSQIRENDGGFAARNLELAKRTTLLFGRIHPDGATIFSDDSYLVGKEPA